MDPINLGGLLLTLPYPTLSYLRESLPSVSICCPLTTANSLAKMTKDCWMGDVMEENAGNIHGGNKHGGGQNGRR